MKKYYVRDKRQTVGNDALWWGKDRKGYTCDLDKAGQFDEAEALEIACIRGTDIPYPVELIDALFTRVLDVQNLPKFAGIVPPDPDTRPPALPPSFVGPTCKGSLMFGNNCGHCERCEWEKKKLAEKAS